MRICADLLVLRTLCFVQLTPRSLWFLFSLLRTFLQVNRVCEFSCRLTTSCSSLSFIYSAFLWAWNLGFRAWQRGTCMLTTGQKKNKKKNWLLGQATSHWNTVCLLNEEQEVHGLGVEGMNCGCSLIPQLWDQACNVVLRWPVLVCVFVHSNSASL